MNPAIILVIDDDVTTLKLVATTLRKHGYEVHTANDARQGLTLALADPPSLIIVDYLMPERTGLDFLHDLRAVPEMKAVPVLMLTASGLIPVVKQAIQAGVSSS
jgi:CheY-like chemotaxis protein